MSSSEPEQSYFDQAADETVALGNQFMEQNPEADPWEVASGLLAGAVHFWLYSRQPCGDPACESCQEIDTAEQRLAHLMEELRQSAEESMYYHSPNDQNVGNA